jgi:hypothetical protein
MKFLLVLLLFGFTAAAANTIDVFGHKWTVPVAADWKVEQEDGKPVLRLHGLGPRDPKPRRPVQFALAETEPWQKATIECEVRRDGGSLILVYAYRDPAHFNYVHLSVDTAKKQPVHNGIFHVYGGDRVRISSDEGPASLPSDQEWYRVRLDYDGSTGAVKVLVNGKENQSLKAVDMSLGAGKVGIGSFFEKALFRNVKITGTPSAP